MAKSEYLVTGGIPEGENRFSVDLNLNEDEQISLCVLLKEALSANGVSMRGAEVVSAPVHHPESHLGRLISLAQRMDAIRCGRKVWNAGREGAQ